jgi:hypothetical protein
VGAAVGRNKAVYALAEFALVMMGLAMSRLTMNLQLSTIQAPGSRFPVERAFLEGVNITHPQHGDKGKH